MAGLFDDDFLRSLLGGQGQGLLSATPGQPSAPAGSMGLLGGFKPSPDEGLLSRFFGTSDPRDGRADAMMNLGAGIAKRDFFGGLAGANRALNEAEDRNWKRTSNALTMGKSAMELQALQDAARRTRAIQEDRARLTGGQGAQGAQGVQAMPAGSDSFGIPTVGDMPLFSLGTQPTRAAGAGGAPNAGAPAGYGMTGQSSAPAASNQRDQLYRKLLQEAEIYSRHGDQKTALEIYQRAEQFKPGKFSTAPQLMKDPRTGALVQVVMNEEGGYQVLPFGAKPDWTIEDMGGDKRAIDRNALPPQGQTWAKTPTFADRNSANSNAISAGNLTLAQQRFNHDQQRFSYEQNKPEIKEVNGQFVAVYPNSPGGPSLKPVAGGEAIAGAGDPKLTEAQGNATQFATRMLDASRTLESVTKDGAPWASTVERAGYKPEFPNWMPGGQVVSAGVAAMNKATTPEAALQVRQAQDNWLTANLRKESGAAIPIPELEAERAKWFPMPGEGEKTTSQKAAARRVAEEAMLSQTGQGKRLVQSTLDKTAPKAPKALPIPANPTTGNLKKDQAYELPNGKVGVWDGFRFKVQTK